MSTQTGGVGETIQIQPSAEQTPEQFDVNIKAPIPDSEQVVETPTAPVTPEPTLPPYKVEGEVVPPSVTREQPEVQVDTQQSVFNKDRVQFQANDEADMPDLSEFTINGVPQARSYAAIPDPEKKEEDKVVVPEPEIDLSEFTINGAPQSNVLKEKESNATLKKQYANKKVEIKDDGTVSLNPKPTSGELPNDIYTYSGRPGVKYKRKSATEWYIDAKNDGNFVPIKGEKAKERAAVLEKNAVKSVGKQLSKSEGTIESTFGNLGKFDKNQYLTADGDVVVTQGLDFGKLTKSNVPTKADRLTNSGQVNFNYDPNYANASKEARVILDAKDKKLPDGYYVYPDNGEVYQKKGGIFYKDVSGKGTNFVRLEKGDVEERERMLEARAVPALGALVASNIRNVKTTGNLIRTGQYTGKLITGIAPENKVDVIEKLEKFDEAKNFAEKDLATMFNREKSLSQEQINGLIQYQKEIKEIVGDGSYDPLKQTYTKELLASAEDFLNESKEINEDINSAYLNDQSLDKYHLEKKRASFDNYLNLIDNTQSQEDALRTFKSSLAIADFIQDAVDDGKMMRKDGVYTYSSNITPIEKEFYEKNLAKLNSEHQNILNERYSSINQEIIDSRSKIRENNVNRTKLKERLKNVEKGSEEYKAIYSTLYEYKKEDESLQKVIDENTFLKSSILLTDPKKVASSLNKTASAETVFNAIPKDITPKQRFDMFYERLQKKNEEIALKNNINEGFLSSASRSFKDLLDWGGFASLSSQEKEWLKNKQTLNALSSVYYNNDSGVSKSSGDFFSSLANSFATVLQPRTAAAKGYMQDSEKANIILTKLQEEGFEADSFVDEKTLEKLKGVGDVEFWSRENFGGMTGTTLGIIAPMVITKKIPLGALKVAGRAESLLLKTNNAQKAATYLTRANNAFESTLKSTKYGKYLIEPIQTGAQAESTGLVFGALRDDISFAQGFAGGFASEIFGAVASKLPASKILGYVESAFGSNANRAVAVIKKIADVNVRATGETVEEFADQLVGIYQDELTTKGFWKEVENQFGTLDKVQKFAISSYMMGLGFGVVGSSNKAKLDTVFEGDKKKQVDAVLSAVREDYETAESAVDDYVEEEEQQNEIEKAIEEEPDTLPKTNEEGDIEFDVNAIERTAEGKPSVVATEEGQPSSFTEPIDFNTTEENDKKDEQGVSSQVGEGEKPVEAEPVAKPSEEALSPSGVVQEEQEVTPNEGVEYNEATTEAIKREKELLERSILSEKEYIEGKNNKRSKLNKFIDKLTGATYDTYLKEEQRKLELLNTDPLAFFSEQLNDFKEFNKKYPEDKIDTSSYEENIRNFKIKEKTKITPTETTAPVTETTQPTKDETAKKGDTNIDGNVQPTAKPSSTEQPQTSVQPTTEPTASKGEATVESLRADEVSEFRRDVENADDFITDGRIDSKKVKASDNAKAKEIYNKYDGKITPLLEKEKKAEPTTEAEEKLSPRVEKIKNDFVESYNKIPERNTAQKRKRANFISSKTSSLDLDERKAAELAEKEISQQRNITETSPTQPTTEAKVEAPKVETEVKAKPTAEAKPQKTKSLPPVKVEAETKRGLKVSYTASVSEDGKTATVEGEPIANAMDTSLPPAPGKTFKDLPIKTDAKGQRYVETPNETRVYLDRVKDGWKPTVTAKLVEKAPIQPKEGDKRARVTIPSSKVITRFTQQLEMVKNKKTGEWEIETKDGKKLEPNEEQKERAEKAFQATRKDKAKKEQIDTIVENTKDAYEGDKGTIEFIESEEFRDGAEAAMEDTNPPKSNKPDGTRKSYMASVARGQSVGLAQELIDRLGKLFENVSLVVDQDSFDDIANQLGRDLATAAILVDGIIYLNPSVANNNTAFEEYAHVYLTALKQVNLPLYNKGLAMVRENGKEYIDEVMNDPAYADIHEDSKAVEFEALSKMIADRGEKVFDGKKKNSVIAYIKDLWKSLVDWLGGKSKLNINDNLDVFIDKVAREMNKNRNISSLTSKDIESIANMGLATVTVNSKSIMAQSSERARWFRQYILPYKGVAEKVNQKYTQARRDINVFEQRSKAVVSDFNKGLEAFYKAEGITSKEDKLKTLQDLNRALIDPIFRAQWFSSNPNAQQHIEASVNKMREMIDDLQQKLIDSNLLTDDLEVSITGNMDMYVNTAYYAFSGKHKGDWMDLFTDVEKEKILEWVYGERWPYAKEMKYTVATDGKVTATFKNGFGIDSKEVKFNNMDEFKTFLGDAKIKGSKGNINVDKLKLGDKSGKSYTLNKPFNFGLDIKALGLGFEWNIDAAISKLNEVMKSGDSASIVHGYSNLTSKEAKGALKQKKELGEIQKLLLKEIKDPTTNFIRTIAKQSDLLFKGKLEQTIKDSGYLASKTPTGSNTQQINVPSSRLNGWYVSPEMYSMLGYSIVQPLPRAVISGVKSVFGRKYEDVSNLGNVVELFAVGSALTKAYVTVLSVGSNAVNYISGYFQLLKTGKLPFGMVSAMRALEQDFEKLGKGKITKEGFASAFLNTMPTIIRELSKLNTNPYILKNGASPLTEDQKKFYEVSSYDELNNTQKAQILLEELKSVGVINSSIDANIISELTDAAFSNEAIPPEMMTNINERLINKGKKVGKDFFDISGNVYSFSDSMFKAVAYLNEKRSNWETYGSIMLKQGFSTEEVEAAMRERATIAVERQMPTYDRSPELIKSLSRFPFLGPFVQFEFQSRVNDYNILKDIFTKMSDSSKMRKDGYTEEANKLNSSVMFKMLGFVAANSISFAMYKLVASYYGWEDDDDDAVRSVLPDYRKNNTVLHLDSNKKGVHEYLDLNRIDPQTVYQKWFNAFEGGGFEGGIDEILKPYISPDIFAGAFVDTYSNINKSGAYDKKIENMSATEKIQYALSERILPSGTLGQIKNVKAGVEGRERAGVTMSAKNELLNMYFGIKIREVNIDKGIGNNITYNYAKDITDKYQQPIKDLNKTYDDMLEQFKRKAGGITQEELDGVKKDISEAVIESNEKSNEILEEAKIRINQYRQLGYTDNELYKILKDTGTPRYMIGIMLSDDKQIEFMEDGSVKGSKTPRRGRAGGFGGSFNSGFDSGFGGDFNSGF